MDESLGQIEAEEVERGGNDNDTNRVTEDRRWQRKENDKYGGDDAAPHDIADEYGQSDDRRERANATACVYNAESNVGDLKYIAVVDCRNTEQLQDARRKISHQATHFKRDARVNDERNRYGEEEKENRKCLLAQEAPAENNRRDSQEGANGTHPHEEIQRVAE